MFDTERALLPEELQPFYVDGAVITRYLKARSDLPASWSVIMTASTPWANLVAFYRGLGESAHTYLERAVFDDEIEFEIGEVLVTLVNLRSPTIFLQTALPRQAVPPPRPLRPPTPGEPAPDARPFDPVYLSGHPRRRDTAPLDARAPEE